MNGLPAAQSLPGVPIGPGTVVRAGADHWTVEILGHAEHDSELWSIRLARQAERKVQGSTFPALLHFHEHPLLRDYHEEWMATYVNEPVPNPNVLLQSLKTSTDGWSLGFRDFRRYLNPRAYEDVLRTGVGLLYSCPASLSRHIDETSALRGIRHTTIADDDVEPYFRAAGLLLLGESYVVGEDIRAERVSDAQGRKEKLIGAARLDPLAVISGSIPAVEMAVPPGRAGDTGLLDVVRALGDSCEDTVWLALSSDSPWEPLDWFDWVSQDGIPVETRELIEYLRVANRPINGELRGFRYDGQLWLHLRRGYSTGCRITATDPKALSLLKQAIPEVQWVSTL